MLPEYSVTAKAFAEGANAANPHLEHLDRMFPAPHVREPSAAYLLGLGCPEDLVPFVQQLNTPEKIQAYMNSNFQYDHSEDTKSLVGIVRENQAHCFEGTIFAYTLLYVHGYNPRVVVFQADNEYGEDHNIVVYRKGDRLGSVTMSAWETLKDRPPVFPTLRDLAFAGYWYAYTSELPEYDGVWNLVGYSDPIDLVDKFGSEWLFKEGKDALWYVFQHYTDDVYCTHLFNGSRYLYPSEDFTIDDSANGQER